jgi:hypothetical protein
VHVSSVQIEDVALAGACNQLDFSFRIFPSQNISKRFVAVWLIVAASGLGGEQLGFGFRIDSIHC